MKRLAALILILCLFPLCVSADTNLYAAFFRSYCDMYGFPAPPEPITTATAMLYDTPDYRIVVSCKSGDPDAVLVTYKKPFDYDFVTLAYCASAAFMPGDYQTPLLMSFVKYDGSTGVAFTADRTGAVLFQETEEGFPQIFFTMDSGL